MATRNFDDFLYKKMSETKLPGLTVAVVRGDEVVHSKAFGSKNIESFEATSTRTNYGIGSITKSFVAVGIGKLVERGKLEFNDPVAKFLPELGRYKAFEQVKVHHLLSHSSGIPGLGSSEVRIHNALGLSKKWFPLANFSDVVSFLDQVDDWAVATPGTAYYYLNEGFVLLGEIISRASGKSYQDFIQEEIFDPLDMRRTFFSKDDLEKDGDYATPYLMKEGKATKSVIPWGSGAAGGLMSNVLDLSNYLVMYMNRGMFRGEKVVDSLTIEKMETPYSRQPMSIFRDYGYGYGLSIVNDFFGEKLVSHGGSVGVYTSSIAYLPHSKLGISVLTNSEGYTMSLFGVYGIMTLLGKDPTDFPVFKREALLERLQGKYSSYKDTVSAQVKKNGDFLVLTGEDIGENIVLVPESEESSSATFFTYTNTAKLPVYFKMDGESVEMIYERYRYRKTG